MTSNIDISAAPKSLDAKVREVFGDLAMDKRRLQESTLWEHYQVPRFVGEWILEQVAPGTGSLTQEEVDHLEAFASRAIPRKDDREIYRSRLVQGDQVKVLAFLQVRVEFTAKAHEHRAEIPVLGFKDAKIDDQVVNDHQELLKSGMWGIIELLNMEDGPRVIAFRPMAAQVNLARYKALRAEFTDQEWRHIMLASAGFNPVGYVSYDAQTALLARLIPIVQQRYNAIELAPKGTGKSFIFENISPRVKIISGGNVSPALLFVDNTSGQKGFLGRYDVLVLDEVQTLRFDRPEEIISALKGYLANGHVSRASKYDYFSDCGFVMLANIPLDENQQPVEGALTETLPEFMRESAFLDRLHAIVPGWDVPKFKGAMIACGTALKADFFSNTLTELRHDATYKDFVKSHIRFPEAIGKRDEEAIVQSATGYLKLLFPHKNVDPETFERDCLWPAIRMRQYVRNELWADLEYRGSPRKLEAEVKREAWNA